MVHYSANNRQADVVRELQALPDSWALVPVKDKAPFESQWQNNPRGKQYIERLLKSGKANGVGVHCGEKSGGLLFVDLDGHSALALAKRMANSEAPFPFSVEVTSGKPGRSQLILKVPQELWGEFKTRRYATGVKGEQLEFRWNGAQSVVIGAHPETDGYRWMSSIDDPHHPAPIADCPHWIIELMLNADEPQQPTKANRDVGSMPIEVCLAKAHRELIESGIGEGGRNNEGFKLACDLIGVSNYLRATGRRFDGDPETLFYQYGDRCDPALPQREQQAIWKSAQKSSPVACLSPDKLENCIKAWESRQKTAVSTAMATPVTGVSDKLKASDSKGFDRSVNLSLDSEEEQKTTVSTAMATPVTGVSDKLKASDSKGFDRSVNLSLDSEEEQKTTAVVTDLEWQSLTQTLQNPGSFNPFQWLPGPISAKAYLDARRLSVDPLMIWSYLLPAIASLMGNDTVLNMSGWKEVNAIWSLNIGESGIGKTLVKRLIGGPLVKRNTKEHENCKIRLEDWAQRESARQKNKSDDSKPEPRPVAKRYLFDKATPQAITKRLSEQEDNGVLWFRDELAGLFKGLNQFSNGKDSEALEILLELKNGDPAIVDRVSDEDSYIMGESRLSIAGGMQPGIFAKIFDTEDPQGVLARFLPVQCEELPFKRYRGETDLDKELDQVYEFVDQTKWGEIRPTVEADDLFDGISEELRNAKAPSANMQPWVRKSAGHCLQIAMVLHVLECYYDRNKRKDLLSSDTLQRAYAITLQYRRHFYHLMGQSSHDGLTGILAKIQDVACTAENGVSARDIARGKGGAYVRRHAQSEGMKPAEFCLKLFEELEEHGYGEIREEESANGRVSMKYFAYPSHCPSETSDTVDTSTQTIAAPTFEFVNQPVTNDDNGTKNSDTAPPVGVNPLEVPPPIENDDVVADGNSSLPPTEQNPGGSIPGPVDGLDIPPAIAEALRKQGIDPSAARRIE